MMPTEGRVPQSPQSQNGAFWASGVLSPPSYIFQRRQNMQEMKLACRPGWKIFLLGHLPFPAPNPTPISCDMFTAN